MNYINLHLGMQYYTDKTGQKYNDVYVVKEIRPTEVVVFGNGITTITDKERFIESFNKLGGRILVDKDTILINKIYNYEIY